MSMGRLAEAPAGCTRKILFCERERGPVPGSGNRRNGPFLDLPGRSPSLPAHAEPAHRVRTHRSRTRRISLTLPRARHLPARFGWTLRTRGRQRFKWQRKRAKDQLQVAQEAADRGSYRLATKAANRVVTVRPLSDYGVPLNTSSADAGEARKMDERAFRIPTKSR